MPSHTGGTSHMASCERVASGTVDVKAASSALAPRAIANPNNVPARVFETQSRRMGAGLAGVIAYSPGHASAVHPTQYAQMRNQAEEQHQRRTEYEHRGDHGESVEAPPAAQRQQRDACR